MEDTKLKLQESKATLTKKDEIIEGLESKIESLRVMIAFDIAIGRK
jgi:hypothetical protein